MNRNYGHNLTINNSPKSYFDIIKEIESVVYSFSAFMRTFIIYGNSKYSFSFILLGSVALIAFLLFSAFITARLYSGFVSKYHSGFNSFVFRMSKYIFIASWMFIK